MLSVNSLGNHPALSGPERLLVMQSHVLRGPVEAFIQQRYAEDYGASVTHFCRYLMANFHQGIISSAVGFARAEESPLFLEQYLGRPVEKEIAACSGTDCQRNEIVEVGNLASSSPGALRRFIMILGRFFTSLERQWVVFTAIPSLLNTFEKFHIPLYELTEADPRALGQDAERWGTYYDKHPRVVAAHLGTGMARMQENALIARLMENQPVPEILRG